MIESVQNQTYGDWELCLADGSDQEHTEVGAIVKEYQQNDKRIRYQQLEKNGGISENTNACLAMASGDYVVLFDHDDLLHECALYELKKAVDEQGTDFIYTDEAVFSKDFHKPDSYHFKTDFAPDDLRSNNYICHITCFAMKLMDEIDGLFRTEYDGSQDFDLVLRLTEKANKIVHIPKVLYFWRNHALSVASDISAKTYCIDAGKKAVKSHLERMGISGSVESSEIYPVIYRVKYQVQGSPLVSIILSEDHANADSAKCEQSIREKTTYSNYEILIRRAEMTWNETAAKAKGEYLLFLDSDCICTQESWLEELLGVAQREEVGAVGAVVSYPKGVIRDAGITLGVGYYNLGSCNFYLLNDDHSGFWGNFYYMHNVSAVSDTCMLVRKKYYDMAGGITPTVAPTVTPMVTPTVTPAPVKSPILKVGKYSLYLGMTLAQVNEVMVVGTVDEGLSPQGNQSYVYNPGGDYSCLIEVQIRDGKVVEMSTISKNFSYGDILTSGDSFSTLTSNGFRSMSTYQYTIYSQTTDDAYVNVMTDKQRDKKAYGVQIFDKGLGSMDSLLYPKNCTYSDAVNKYQARLSALYLNAYRAYHGIESLLNLGDNATAQSHSEYMAKVNSDVMDEGSESWKDRFNDAYGDPLCKSEYVSYGSRMHFRQSPMRSPNRDPQRSSISIY